jgi:hypothetical protein
MMMLLSFAAIAQKKDSLRVRPSYIPTGIRVGTDVISLIRWQADDSFSGYEVNVDVDFYRYYLAAEVGHWERNFLTDEEYYNNGGNYFRVGIDVNFLKKDPDKNMLFFGMRYGSSTYSEYLTVMNDPVWGTVDANYSNTNIHAGWGELTTGLRVKMLKFFWMGYTARFKFGLNTHEPGGFVSYDVPGYGKTGNETTWGFNYQLLFRIPIRKQK